MSSRNLRNNRGRTTDLPSGKPSQGERSSESLHPLIDFQENVDDVVEISPRGFAEVCIQWLFN